MIGNGKKVVAKGNLPKAKNSKAEAIHNMGKMKKMMGGFVRATSHNYGIMGTKGRALRGAGGPEEGEE